MNHIFFSSSMIKEMGVYVCDEEIIIADHCPKLVHAKYISNQKIESEPSLAMLKGSYFETKSLGSGRGGKRTTDLPRLKNGNMSIDQKRILDQVVQFKKFCIDRSIVINEFNTQIPLVAPYRDNGDDMIWLKGELDVFPTTIDYQKISIIDLKLTQDTSSDFFTPSKARQCSNGCWGKPEFIAKNQPLIYHYLVRNMNIEHIVRYNRKHNKDFDDFDEAKLRLLIDDKLIERADNITFYYLVFGIKEITKSDIQREFIEYEWTSHRRKILDKMIHDAYILYCANEASGWEANPVKGICKNCVINCEFKHKDKKL